MADTSSKTPKKDAQGLPEPETLRPQSETKTDAEAKPKAASPQPAKSLARAGRRLTYRPSHKATFIGLGVVIAILAVNAGVIAFLMSNQGSAESDSKKGEVTISSSVLNSLGVSRNPVGNLGTELVVGPDSSFNGSVTMNSDVSIAGKLQLNSTFSAADASLTKLQAGDVSLNQLNVNGDGTISNLNLRKDLVVVGATRLQGPVTLSQLLTINNNVNISGSLAVGGTLSVRNFQASSLTSDTTLTIGGHVITRGSAPGVSSGPAVGSNGTVSISGNDAAGTVATNIGVGGGNGILAYVSFRQPYGTTPHVVVTMIGRGATGSWYINRSSTGFNIGINGSLPPGGYAFDYIVMQ